MEHRSDRIQLCSPTTSAPNVSRLFLGSLYEPITGVWLGELEADDGTIAFVVGSRKIVSEGLAKALKRLSE